MYKACRCEICGEVYLGTEKPDTCPFCGAHKHHMESMGMDEFRTIMPDDFEKMDENEEMSLFIDLDEEDLPEISEDLVEKIRAGARDYGILEAYSIFAKQVSDEAAEKFFKELGELEIR